MPEEIKIFKRQYATFNIGVIDNAKNIVRNDVMEGRDWLVVPTQMITEGVHNGDGGPIFYSAEELAKMPMIWNSKPVVVYHPTQNGKGISACSPLELTTRGIGRLMNTVWNSDTKKLGTETWLDPQRIDIIDPRIRKAIKNNTVMEVSTGLFMDLEEKEGDFNGKHYTGIAHNLQPDHLAILPDKKGACSIADGAGFLRVNESGDVLCQNELSHDGLRTKLQAALKTKTKNTNSTAPELGTYINDVFDNFFVYELGNKLYKQNYSIDAKENITLSGLPQEVIRKVTYVSVTSVLKQNNLRIKNNYAIFNNRKVYIGV